MGSKRNRDHLHQDIHMVHLAIWPVMGIYIPTGMPGCKKSVATMASGLKMTLNCCRSSFEISKTMSFNCLMLASLFLSHVHALHSCELAVSPPPSAKHGKLNLNRKMLNQTQCRDLSRAVPDRFFGGPEASTFLWSAFQTKIQPECRIEPRNSSDVANTLAVARQYECHFAILGGGVSPYRRASNADQGITIDMRRMKNIAFVAETTIKVEAGSVWGEVYRALEPFNMSATGTRSSLTGVVGSILGGML